MTPAPTHCASSTGPAQQAAPDLPGLPPGRWRSLSRPNRSPALLPMIAAVGVVGTLAVSGCQVLSPQQTMKPYQPAEGISVTLGEVEIRNLLVVSSAKDSPGVLSGYVVNKSASPTSLSIGAAAGAPVTAQLDAKSTTRLSGGDGVSVAPLATVASAPGGLVQLNISTPAGGTEQVQVPVLLPREYFATVTPSATPTPTLAPTDSSTATPGDTTTATATASPSST